MVNIGNMMKQAQQLQKKMADAQEKLNSIEVEGTSGGGMVKIIMNCKNEVKKIDVDPIKRKNRCQCNRPLICFINALVWDTDKYMNIKKSRFF